MHRSFIRLPLLLVITLLALRRPGEAHAGTAIIDGEIRQLIVSGDRVAAIRGGALVLLTTTGQVIARPSGDREALPRPAPRRRPSADDIVDLYGIPDDDLESDLVRDALDDEGIAASGGRRRPARESQTRESRSSPQALAASRDAIWISTRTGLLRLQTGGAGAEMAPSLPVPVGPTGVSFSAIAVAPTGDALAAVAGNHVLRSSDGGVSWTPLAVLAARARGVAISADGRDVFVLDDDGVAVVTHHQRIALFEGEAHDLIRCGDDLLILGDDGLYAWRWEQGLERRAERLPARRLTCSPAVPGALIAIGPVLLSSFDDGRTWIRRGDLPLLEIEGVAIGPDRLFVGAASGLFMVPLVPLIVPAIVPSIVPAIVPSIVPSIVPAIGPSGRPVTAPAAPMGDVPFLRRLRPSPWHDLLPRVSLVVTAAASHRSNYAGTDPGRAQSAGWLLLTFPLGHTRAASLAVARHAGDLLRRRALAAAEWARLAAQTPYDEEAAAMLRVVEQTLEALR